MGSARRYRCSHQIIYEMLVALTKKPLGKTKLCSRSNMPLDRCSELLIELENRGLIYKVREGNRDFYRIAEAGYVYVSLYEKLLGLVPFLGHRRR